MQTISENLNLSGSCFFLKFCIEVSEQSLGTGDWASSVRRCAIQPREKSKARQPTLVGILPSLAPGQERAGMIYAVIEAVLSMPFHLAWKGLLICEQLSTPAPRNYNTGVWLKSERNTEMGEGCLRGLTPFIAGAYTATLVVRVTEGTSLLLCPSNISRQGI